MPTDINPVNEAIIEMANTLGIRSGPAIADAIIGNVFPKTLKSAQAEGAEHILRNGLIAHVSRLLKSTASASAQIDLSSVEATFGEYIRPLKSKSYFVPSREEYVVVADLISRPGEIKEAAANLRKHGRDCIDEADRLELLFEAVTGSAPIPSNDDAPASDQGAA